MNIVEYKELTDRYYGAEIFDPALKQRISDAKDDLLPGIRDATGVDYGWIRFSNGDIYFYDVKSSRLEYFTPTVKNNLDTINGGTVSFMTTYDRVPSHYERMLEYIEVISKPVIKLPVSNDIVGDSTISLTVPEPQYDQTFQGVHQYTEWWVSTTNNYKDVVTIKRTSGDDILNLKLYLDKDTTYFVKARYSTGLYYGLFSDTITVKSADYTALPQPTIVYDNYTEVFASFPNEGEIIEVVWETSTVKTFEQSKTLRIIKHSNFNKLSLRTPAGVSRYIRVKYHTSAETSSWSDVYKYQIPDNYFINKPSVLSTVGTHNQISTTPYSPSINNTSPYAATIWYIEQYISDTPTGGTKYFTSSNTSHLPYTSHPGTYRVQVRHIDTDGHISAKSDPTDITITDTVPITPASITIKKGNGVFYHNSIVQIDVSNAAVSTLLTIEVFVTTDKNELIYVRTLDIAASDINTSALSIPIFDTDETDTNNNYRVLARCIIDGVGSKYFTFKGKLIDTYGKYSRTATPDKGGDDTRCLLVHNEDSTVLKIGGSNSGYEEGVSNGIWSYQTNDDTWSYLTHTFYTHIPTDGAANYDTSGGTIYITDGNVEKISIDPMGREPFDTTATDGDKVLNINTGKIVNLNSIELFYLGGVTSGTTPNTDIWYFSPTGWKYMRPSIISPLSNIVVYNNAAYYKEVISSELHIYKYIPPDASNKTGRTVAVTTIGIPDVDGLLLSSEKHLYYMFKTDGISYLAKYDDSTTSPRWFIVMKIPYSVSDGDHASIVFTDNNNIDVLYGAIVASQAQGYSIPIP